MRMSCNGCRVLRKGCNENCSIRPCLQWIKSPDSQANATVFLAKFYGRAGLINLINSGPEHLRPSIFRSLLYEACGRIVNPIYGSVGLLWSGSWHLCQAAVEAVLKGASITPINFEAASTGRGPPFKACDIRHVSKNASSTACRGTSRVRGRRRATVLGKPKAEQPGAIVIDLGLDDVPHSASHESSPSHHSVTAADSKDSESMDSVETTHDLQLLPADRPSPSTDAAPIIIESGDIHLELTLGLEPSVVPMKKRRLEKNSSESTVGLTRAVQLSER